MQKKLKTSKRLRLLKCSIQHSPYRGQWDLVPHPKKSNELSVICDKREIFSIKPSKNLFWYTITKIREVAQEYFWWKLLKKKQTVSLPDLMKSIAFKEL